MEGSMKESRTVYNRKKFEVRRSKRLTLNVMVRPNIKHKSGVRIQLNCPKTAGFLRWTISQKHQLRSLHLPIMCSNFSLLFFRTSPEWTTRVIFVLLFLFGAFFFVHVCFFSTFSGNFAAWPWAKRSGKFTPGTIFNCLKSFTHCKQYFLFCLKMGFQLFPEAFASLWPKADVFLFQTSKLPKLLLLVRWLCCSNNQVQLIGAPGYLSS